MDHPHSPPSLQEREPFFIYFGSDLQKFNRGLTRKFSEPLSYVLDLLRWFFQLKLLWVTRPEIIFIFAIAMLWPLDLLLCFSVQTRFLIFIITSSLLPVATETNQLVLPDQIHPHQNCSSHLFLPILLPIQSRCQYRPLLLLKVLPFYCFFFLFLLRWSFLISAWEASAHSYFLMGLFPS